MNGSRCVGSGQVERFCPSVERYGTSPRVPGRATIQRSRPMSSLDTTVRNAAGPAEVESGSTPDASLSTPGTRRGRYLVLGELGRGGMGVVLHAYDPKLRREVALKCLAPGRLNDELQARLVREAHAMAKLTHPNVVSVYDVELEGQSVTVAMEFVDGTTLAALGSSEGESSREVMALYRQAGRGLAAAHRAGLLHRDFKPGNVLVSREGVAKVTDFGIARFDDDGGVASDDSLTLGNDASLMSRETLTRGDIVLGTPRYMAPEQLQGAELGPTADQYAFCLSLWEALTGMSPYCAPHNLRELLVAKLEGPPPWPRGTSVPSAWSRAICRGLQPRPHERWPSMDALLQALDYDPSRRLVSWVLGGVGLGLLAFGALGWTRWAELRGQRCTGGERKLTRLWGEDRVHNVRRAMLAVDVAYAKRVWTRTKQEIDEYTKTWGTVHREACEATTLRGEQSVATMESQIACLDRAALELQATLALFEQADVATLQRAHRLTDALPSLRVCADVHSVAEEVAPPDPAQAPLVDGIRAILAESKAEMRAGRFHQAQTSLRTAQARLEDVRYEPLRIELRLHEGRLMDEMGEYDSAQRALYEALELASSHHQWAMMRDAATALIYVLGCRLERVDEAEHYLRIARALARGDPLAQATIANEQALLLEKQGDLEGAQAEAERALRLRTGELGERHPSVAQSLHNIAAILNARGDHQAAHERYRRALEIRTQELGVEHPLTFVTRNNLAHTSRHQGRYEEAVAEFRRVLEPLAQAYGAGHPDVAMARNGLASALYQLGEYDEARLHYERALELEVEALGPEHSGVANLRANVAMVEATLGNLVEAERQYRDVVVALQKTLGVEHPNTIGARANLANVLKQQSKFDEAVVMFEEVLEHGTKTLGPKHPHLAMVRNNLGDVLRARGRADEGEDQYRRALEICESSLGAEHPWTAQNLGDLAEVLHEQGRDDEARSLAQRAWDIGSRGDGHPAHRANAAFLLARILWKTERTANQRRIARELAEQALELLERSEDVGIDQERNAIRRWLERHAVVEGSR